MDNVVIRCPDCETVLIRGKVESAHIQPMAEVGKCTVEFVGYNCPACGYHVEHMETHDLEYGKSKGYPYA